MHNVQVPYIHTATILMQIFKGLVRLFHEQDITHFLFLQKIYIYSKCMHQANNEL